MLVGCLLLEELAQRELPSLRIEQTALGLRTEELPLEPLRLPLQLVVGLLQFLVGFQKRDDLIAVHRSSL